MDKIKQVYTRTGIHSLEAVLPFITGERSIKKYGKYEVKMASQRYKVFNKSCKCVKCGIEGKYFALEKDSNCRDNSCNRFHFNLYAVNSEGIEVLMTKDHILPISKGGKNILENYQTMCSTCNTKKGSNI